MAMENPQVIDDFQNAVGRIFQPGLITRMRMGKLWWKKMMG